MVMESLCELTIFEVLAILICHVYKVLGRTTNRYEHMYSDQPYSLHVTYVMMRMLFVEMYLLCLSVTLKYFTFGTFVSIHGLFAMKGVVSLRILHTSHSSLMFIHPRIDWQHHYKVVFDHGIGCSKPSIRKLFFCMYDWNKRATFCSKNDID